MKENVLKDFETFDEFPDKYLCINRKSDYYLIMIDYVPFVAKRSSNSIFVNEKEIFIDEKFYNVLDGSLVLERNNSNKSKEKDSINIVLFSSILKDNETMYFTKQQIELLTGITHENVYKKV